MAEDLNISGHMAEGGEVFNPGLAGLLMDFSANFKGDFNSLLAVPSFIIFACILGLFRLGGLRRCWQKQSDDEEDGRSRMSTVPLMHDVHDGRSVCGLGTLRDMILPGKIKWMQTRAAHMNTYTSVGVVSALMLSTSMGKFSSLSNEGLHDFDVQLHGIIWCTATYSFFCAVVGAVSLNIAYGKCRDDVQADVWTRKMGDFALRMPMIATDIGSFLFVIGTTHIFILNFRKHQANHDTYDFSICAAFCYSALPFTVIIIFKVHYCIGILQRQDTQLMNLAQLDYEDIDAMFMDYMKSGELSQPHLDVHLDDFLQFQMSRKIWRGGKYRGGVLRGLRATYAESLVSAFQALERRSQEQRAEAHAQKIFDTLFSRISSSDSLGSNGSSELPACDVPQVSPKIVKDTMVL